MKTIMRARIIFISLFALLVTNTFSQVKVSGRLIDDKTIPVEFANVALQSADKFQGTISDDKGNFEIQVLPGVYNLKISAIGYDTYENELTVQTSNIDLGEIRLPESSVEIGEVVVKADRIIRKADRFVVNLMNDPTLHGKTGTDILNQSPGVFIQERDGTISINGKTGAQVYINERPVHYSGQELVSYLQSFKAEDIVRIEVVPLAGADYDASITGGVIKITLKKQRNEGLNGSIGSTYSFAPEESKKSSLMPSFNLNYRYNRLSLYTRFNYGYYRQIEHVVEEVNTLSAGRTTYSDFDFPTKVKIPNIILGTVYDLNDKQSIGVEGNFSRQTITNHNGGLLTETIGNDVTNINSLFDGKAVTDNYSVSANYILQLDEQGSIFKILLDYHHNESDNNQNYNSEYRGYLNYDTIYRSNITSENDLYAISTDLSVKVNENSTFSAGLKYTYNDMKTSNLFEYKRDAVWNVNAPYTNAGTFTENIAAVYASFNSSIKKINYSIGLRGEYTAISPWSDKSDATEDQKYFKLFPTINVMLPFGEDNKHSVVLNYNRKVVRPAFSQLNPFRVPGSEYFFFEGNPKLEAVTPDDVSFSLRLFNKYNLSIGMTDTRKSPEMIITTDPNNPNIIIQRTENIGRNRSYYMSANASVRPLTCWQIYINGWASHNRLKIFESQRLINIYGVYFNNSFTLPKGFMLDFSGQLMSGFFRGNMEFDMPNPILNTSIRKQFLNNKLNVNLSVNNILDKGTFEGVTKETDFTRVLNGCSDFRQIALSLTYNFNLGKSVNVKNVETGAAEEKARMQ